MNLLRYLLRNRMDGAQALYFILGYCTCALVMAGAYGLLLIFLRR